MGLRLTARFSRVAQAYWPPEVLATGATQRVHVCRKADQFGFAVTFLELFTLKLPWTVR